jgi:hypothetical protein
MFHHFICDGMVLMKFVKRFDRIQLHGLNCYFGLALGLLDYFLYHNKRFVI